MSPEAIDILWLTVTAVLVFFMQAGFAMVESGLVRSKNAVNVLMKNYVDLGFSSIAFWAIGFGLMFGTNPTGWFGTDLFFLHGVSDWTFTNLLFQMMFAATAATIVSGALAERIRYHAYVISGVVISAVVYSIFGSWVWGSFDGSTSGWLKQLGFVDFAGSAVVHSIGGWAALAGVVVLGPRLGRFGSDGKPREISGHNLPLFALGALILWMGWFGFNGGSTLAVNSSIGPIVLNTHLSGCAGIVGAMFILTVLGRPLLMTTTVNGGLAGLVAVCAGANSMPPWGALLVGFIAGIIMVFALNLLLALRLDDAVGAVAVHGFGGTWGTIAAGFFVDGAFGFSHVGVQVLGAGTAFVWAFGTCWILFKIIDWLIGLRVTSLQEQRGLDFAEHYEICYPEFQQDVLHGGKD